MRVDYIDHMGNDLSVVNAARVSFDKESDWANSFEYFTGKDPLPYLTTQDERLIKYLAKHKHYSPFNHTYISLRVKAPIFVARQLQKHEYMPWNEVSRRYVDSPPEFYIPNGWRGRSKDKKQGSEGVANPGILPWDTYGHAVAMYNVMLDHGVAPEQARMVLPQSMYTEWIWSGTLKAWAKMLKLRLDPHAQQETREVAEQCENLINPLFPISLAALLESGVE